MTFARLATFFALASMATLTEAQSHGTPAVTVCSSSKAIVQDLRTVFSPSVVYSEKNVSWVASAVLSDTVTNGTAHLTITVDGVVIDRLVLDLCDFIRALGVSCPIPSGTTRRAGQFKVPPFAVYGQLNVHAIAYTDEGAEIACMNVDMQWLP